MILQPHSDHAALLEQVHEFTGVAVDRLDVYLIPPARTTFITDRATVFVKRTIGDGVQEVQGSTYASKLGLPTPRILAHRSLGESSLLAFEYLEGSMDLLFDPLPLLQTMWRHEPLSDFVSADLQGRRRRALANIQSLPRPEQIANQSIVDLIEGLTVEETKLLQSRKPKQAWIHGDCHERNLVLFNATPTILDFEWSGVGWRETDAAKWLQCNISESDRTSVDAFWSSLKTTDLDLDLVKLEVRQSAARAYTYQLRWQTRTDWLEGLRNLALGEDAVFKTLS